MLLDYVVLSLVLAFLAASAGCGIYGLICNSDIYAPKSLVNLLVGLTCALFGVGTTIPAVYCKYHEVAVYIVPGFFLLVGIAYIATSIVQKRQNA